MSIGLGDWIGPGFDWYVGADRAIAYLAKAAIGFSSKQSTLLGAGLASCLGAAAVFRSMIGLDTLPRRLSCWNYAEGVAAAPGPEAWQHLDVGRVLTVGAGAVAASLTFWLAAFGVGGDWTVIDGDVVALHNINRGMVFTAADAGWPSGIVRKKAELLANFIPSVRWADKWYHESGLADENYDVVLGLANDYDVRHLIASRNNVVTLHATTGVNWLSQLHRHITGLDDCIWCRAGEASTPAFRCSTGEVNLPGGTKSDAALPFLSAASGLMLAAALQRLQRDDLATMDRNDWRWDFDSLHKMATSSFRRCREGCSRALPPRVRGQINRASRWRQLDKEIVDLS